MGPYQPGRCAPFSAGRAYVNFMMDDGQKRVKASYDAITNAWQTVKVKYDPASLFRGNQNIHRAS
jgi:Berberine and berberine like